MGEPPAPPTAAALLALGTDAWATVLAVALPVVRQLPEPDVDAVVRRVAAVPPGRLMAGRSRRDLAEVLAREQVWRRVEEALPDGADRPWQDPPADAPAADQIDPAVTRLEQRVAHLAGREQGLVDKVAALRAQVDALRRERDGAVVRAEAAEAAAEAARHAADAARATADEAQRAADAADERVARAVERERRRDDGTVARLEEELRTVRRECDELRRRATAAEARAVAAEERAEVAAAQVPVAGGRRPATGSGRRGRPSRLPDGIEPGTTEAASWLVAEGRLLLVDGYNVTRTTRPQLTFPEQRAWLETAVEALAQRRHVEATIVWDSAHGRPTARRSRSGVIVQFTEDGITADDQLVYHVEVAVGPDTPVVVVTDDRGLRQRLAEHRVDLLDSRSFTWLL